MDERSGPLDADPLPHQPPRRTPAAALLVLCLLLFGTGIELAPPGLLVNPYSSTAPNPSEAVGPNVTGPNPWSANETISNQPASNGTGNPGGSPNFTLGQIPAGGPGTVTVVVINVTMSILLSDKTRNGSEADPIYLEHCARAFLNESGVYVHDPDYNASAEVVVLIQYPHEAYFGVGGDDVLAYSLHKGDRLAVGAAYSKQEVLYEVVVGDQITVRPVAANGTPPELSTTYTVANATAYPATGTWEPVTISAAETHRWSVFENVELRSAGPWTCD